MEISFTVIYSEAFAAWVAAGSHSCYTGYNLTFYIFSTECKYRDLGYVVLSKAETNARIAAHQAALAERIAARQWVAA